jgi:hypothetical protein
MRRIFVSFGLGALALLLFTLGAPMAADPPDAVIIDDCAKKKSAVGPDGSDRFERFLALSALVLINRHDFPLIFQDAETSAGIQEIRESSAPLHPFRPGYPAARMPVLGTLCENRPAGRAVMTCRQRPSLGTAGRPRAVTCCVCSRWAGPPELLGNQGFFLDLARNR